MSRFSVPETALLAAFAQALRAAFGPRVQTLQVFGSRARGDSTADSDIDVFVAIEGLTWQERDAVLDIASDLSAQSTLLLSQLVRDPAAFAPDSPLAADIARDGVPLPEHP